MAVIVERQGEQMDDIEQNMADAGAYIHGGTNALFSALKLLTGLFQSRYMDKRMEVNDSSSKDLEGNAGNFGKNSEHHDGIDSGPHDSNTIEKKDIPTEINFEEEVDIARKVLNNLIAYATETSHDDLAQLQTDKEPSIFESSEEPSKSSFETAKASDVPKPEKLSKSMAPNLEQTRRRR
ncbi:PREDICTED: RNA-binding 28 [Prunus dulcis]|uniref:PREDICTED: RNA-binding 28 n=1 Tax=Prunus dulcis TaxID=3755 RepID=A0A5E4G7D3_PRUDU|nr:PREDICTED: RNA-binding 28 [Prunus dulcis]